MTTFRELGVWSTFDWINDSNPMFNSYFARCVKTGPRTYRAIDAQGKPTGATMRVGSHKAPVFHGALPEVAAPAPKAKRRRTNWSDTVRDPLDEKDNLGESPDY